MTAYVATTGLPSLAGRDKNAVALRESEASLVAASHAVPTPFYDQLMSMIQATAQESARAEQDYEISAHLTGDDRRRVHPLIPCIAAVIVAAAIGRVALLPGEGHEQPQMIVAGADALLTEPSLPEPPLAAGKAVAPELPMVGPVAATQIATEGGSASVEVEPRQAAAPAFSDTAVNAAYADERSLAMPAAGLPEIKVVTPADVVAFAKVVRTIPIVHTVTAERPPPPPPALPSTMETGSIANTDAAAPTRTARIVSDVNLRAGPGNGQPVLATIARGRSVEVVECRGWCEVIYAGRRGWVYKSFVEASPNPGGH
jgi:hypothetical protein